MTEVGKIELEMEINPSISLYPPSAAILHNSIKIPALLANDGALSEEFMQA